MRPRSNKQAKAKAIGDHAIAQAEARARRAAALATKLVTFVKGVVAAPGSHPELEEMLLDLSWLAIDNAVVVTRFPVTAWPEIRAEIDSVYEAVKDHPNLEAVAARAGIHLPDGVDLDAEARAQDDLRGGKTE